MQSGNKINASMVYDLISGIPDPEIPVISIKDLGILRDVKLINDDFIVTITPTYTACPAMGLIEGQILEILENNSILNVKVNLTYSPAWTTDWINHDARNKLRSYGIAPPKNNACSKVQPLVDKIQCPHCMSYSTELISQFGSTACKALYKCNDCKEPFDYFKCH